MTFNAFSGTLNPTQSINQSGQRIVQLRYFRSSAAASKHGSGVIVLSEIQEMCFGDSVWEKAKDHFSKLTRHC